VPFFIAFYMLISKSQIYTNTSL